MYYLITQLFAVRAIKNQSYTNAWLRNPTSTGVLGKASLKNQLYPGTTRMSMNGEEEKEGEQRGRGY